MIQPNPKKKIVKKKQQDDVNLFTPEETKQRRGSLGLPKSKAEEKAYYDRMRKEGAKNGKTIKKAKSGGKFPDLNKDGKITKADILKGRGVIAKKGAAVKKAKSGTSMKKCKYGCK